MGRLKQLLPWAGTTLIDWQVGQLRAGGADEVIIVLGKASEEISASLRESATDARIVVNDAYREGRASSVRRGAEATEDRTEVEVVIVANVDQPRPAWVLRRLIEQQQASHSGIVTPRFGGRGGHPLLLAGGFLDQLRTVTERDLGLRAVLDRNAEEIESLEFEDATVNVDLNTPEDYQAALAALDQGLWNEKES